METETDLSESSTGCGVIIYTILNDNELCGIWTSPEYEGKIGKEKAHKTKPGKDKVSGEYEVKIWDPEGQEESQGNLIITLVGSTYHLEWKLEKV